MRTKVICAPSGSGKSYTANYLRTNNINAISLNNTEHLFECDPFSYNQRKPSPKYPYNLIGLLEEYLGKVDVIFIDSDPRILEWLDKNEIYHAMVYPDKGMLNEWVGRLYIKHQATKICDIMISEWDTMIEDIENHYTKSEYCIGKYTLTHLSPYILNKMGYINTLPF